MTHPSGYPTTMDYQGIGDNMITPYFVVGLSLFALYNCISLNSFTNVYHQSFVDLVVPCSKLFFNTGGPEPILDALSNEQKGGTEGKNPSQYPSRPFLNRG